MQYLREYPNVLSREVCQDIMARFDADERKHLGVIGRGYNPDVKQSTDLKITGLPEWEDIDRLFQDSVEKYVPHYIVEVVNQCGWAVIEPFDKGYQIQRTEPGGFYHWHQDYDCYSLDRQFTRCITCIWYLNDIEEGGHTEFITGEKIKPEAGKLLLFPATWTFAHRGTPPVNQTKYLCTTWIYSKHYLDESLQQELMDSLKEQHPV